MNKRLLLLPVLMLVSIIVVEAQLAMGNWRTHFAYNNVNQLANTPNKVFAVSDGSLFSIDKRDGNMEFYSKLSGLNGTTISKIKYDEVSKILVIIYNNGNIDFLSDSGVKNLPDFYNKQMTADKTINHIHFFGDKAYLSCNFGIITINMKKQEIQDTYYIGTDASEIKVLNTAVLNNQIFATSATDIYTASLSNPYLISYESWSKLTGLPGSGNIQSLTGYGDYLVLLRNGKLYKKGSNNIWNDLDVTQTYTQLLTSGNKLIAITAANTYIFDNQLTKTTISTLTALYDGIFDNVSGLYWFATGAKGIAQYKISGESPVISFYKPEGPAVNIPYQMRFAGQKLFVVQGGRLSDRYLREGLLMIYENNSWKNIYSASIKSILGSSTTVLDFMDIAIDPDDNKHFFIPSYGNGVFEFKNDEFSSWYNFNNSTIETIFPTTPSIANLYMRTDAGLYDDNKNIWFTNSQVSYGIKVLKNDGTWISLGTSDINGNPTLGTMLINKNNKKQKWMLAVRSGAVIVFDDNGTIDNPSDDKSVFLQKFTDPDKGTLFNAGITLAIAQDKNGAIWVGTDKGPFIFNNPNNAFDADYNCTRIKIPRNDGTNLADYLLESDYVQAIAIDGANRKWLGTRNSGVYLMSENGQQTIKHFTQENSPLLSNNILSLAINPISGEVFFGTGNGLVSYQSDAADGVSSFTNVHAYPNPVRENYTGIITITGLVDKTNVKITDLAGNLVCETVSNGSIATWDGKNGYGQKVSTGVYLALCISPEGTESTTTKILVIN